MPIKETLQHNFSGRGKKRRLCLMKDYSGDGYAKRNYLDLNVEDALVLLPILTEWVKHYEGSTPQSRLPSA